MLFKLNKNTNFLHNIQVSIKFSTYLSHFCLSHFHKSFSSYSLNPLKSYQMASISDSNEQHVSKRQLNEHCEPDGEDKKLKPNVDNSQECSLVKRQAKLKKFAVLISYSGVGYFGLQK